FSAGTLGAQIVFEGGSEEQKKSWLPQICAGNMIPVPALADTAAAWGPESVETRLAKSGDGLTLTGKKRFVFDAEAATHFIVAARTDNGEIALVLIDRKSAGVSVNRLIGFTVSAGEVVFDQARIASQNVLSAGSGWRVLDAARWAAYEALWMLDTGQPAKATVHEAKAIASEGYHHACNYAHMVFAGPGTDYGHPLMAHSVLAHTMYQYLGTPAHHKRLMMDVLFPRK